MKKILTLLVMFLATASILTAQTPQLNYQMIVRDQNNKLVYNTTVSGTVNVITTGVTNPVYTKNFSEKTNMNGMLTIILDNQSGPTNLEKIDWAHSQFRVVIGAYGIDTTMDIYPVLYAYNVFTDSNITTPRILKYIENSTVNDVIRIDSAITHNEGFITALRDSVANAMKRNPNMVKELAIYFLASVTKEDVGMAYDTLDDQVVDKIAEKIAEYAKNHRAAAYDVLKYYVGQATVNDVAELWSSAMHNPNADTIIYMVVDSVNHYIALHKQWIKNAAKYVVEHVSVDDISGMYTFFKTNNNDTYEYMKGVLDSLINDYLVSNNYLSAKCGDEIITLCDLNAQIEQLQDNGFKACPSFGNNMKNGDLTIETPIIPSAEVDLSQGVYYYEIYFPGTTYDTINLPVQLQTEGNNNFIAINIGDWATRTVVVRPAMKQKCMDVVTYGKYDTTKCEQDCELPVIASFTQTGTNVAALNQNHGVALTAKLTNNYYTNAQMPRGFQYSIDNGTTWEPMQHTVYDADGLTFSDTIKMDLCGKSIQVRAYVDRGNHDTNFSQTATIQLRELRLVVTPENPVLANNSVELTATNGIHISTQSYIDELGTEWPSVEQIVAKYGSEFGVNVVPTYTWTGTNTNFSSNANPVQVDAADTYTVTCSFSIFNSAPCVLTKTVTVR